MKIFPPSQYTVLILATPFVLLGIDIVAPLGVALGVLQVATVLFTLPLKHRRVTLLVAAQTSLCIVLGYWSSPAGGESLWMSQINRVLSLGVVWSTTWVVLRAIRSSLTLEDLHKNLEDRIHERTMELQERNRATFDLLKDIEAARKELDQTEKQFRQIIEAAPSGIVMVDQQGHITLANKLIVQQFAYAKEEVIGQPIEVLLPERFRERHVRFREEFLGSPESRRMGKNRELLGRRKDGSEFPVEVTLAPIMVGKSTFVLAMVLDITERIQARKALIESEARNRNILESACEGIFGLDMHGHTTFVNSAAAGLLGYSPEELIGAPMHALFHHTKADGSAYPREECPIYATFVDGSVHHVEDEVFWRKDGTSFPVAYSSSPKRDELGHVFGAVVTFSDITDKKEVEQALLKRNQALKASNQELDDFAYIVSHDLKEPLRGIHNYSSIILEDHGDKLPGDVRTRCETLLRLSQHMETLLDSLLYYSRDGRSELAMKPTDLGSVVQNILESLDVSLKECGTLVKISQDFPTLLCDRVRVGEIFRNLITNAMKYNDKSEKWIEIGYLEDQSDVLEVLSPLVFYVRDNGIGIREKHLDSVFRMFKRLNGRDKFGGGTGAGLTLTKKMVERHGGRIWVESVFGEGTTFYFTLAPNQGMEKSFVQELSFSETAMA